VVALSDIDQLVAPPAARANEVNAEAVDAEVDILIRDIHCAANAFPHRGLPELGNPGMAGLFGMAAGAINVDATTIICTGRVSPSRRLI
jgi:hypothetical protein